MTRRPQPKAGADKLDEVKGHACWPPHWVPRASGKAWGTGGAQINSTHLSKSNLGTRRWGLASPRPQQ